MARVTGPASGDLQVPERDPPADQGTRARRWAEQTRAAQGVPSKVGDEGTLRKVAVLLASGREPVGLSDPPVRDDSGLVEPVPASHGGLDGNASEQGRNDGPLAGGGEVGPLAS